MEYYEFTDNVISAVLTGNVLAVKDFYLTLGNRQLFLNILKLAKYYYDSIWKVLKLSNEPFGIT